MTRRGRGRHSGGGGGSSSGGSPVAAPMAAERFRGQLIYSDA
jgi:hypothetical protein